MRVKRNDDDVPIDLIPLYLVMAPLPAVAAEFLVLALPLSIDMVLDPRVEAATTGLFLILEEDITM